MSDIDRLLPPSATASERAIETVIAERTIGIDAPIATLWNVDTCPEELLPWMAWAFSVEVWDHAWSETVKRNVIRNSVQVHRMKGTRRAVELALEALEMRIDLHEGFEIDEHGDPYGPPHTFTLDAFADDVFAAGFQVDERLHALVTELLRHTKPVRSHFTLRIGESFNVTTTAKVGLRQRRRHGGALSPQPRPHEIESALGLAPGLRRRMKNQRTLLPQPRPHALFIAARVGAAMRARQSHKTTYQVTPREGAAYAK